MNDPAHADPGRRPGATRLSWLLIGVFFLLALGAGIVLGNRYRDAHSAPPPTADTEPEANAYPALQATRLPDSVGRLQSFAQWRGKILVVNFWATWCPPCREEIPALSRLQEKHAASGVQVVGIAIDNAENVAAYSKSGAIAYPVLIGDNDLVELNRVLGNPSMALPYTVVFDATGKVRMHHMGRIVESDIDGLLQGLTAR